MNFLDITDVCFDLLSCIALELSPKAGRICATMAVRAFSFVVSDSYSSIASLTHYFDTMKVFNIPFSMACLVAFDQNAVDK